MNWLNREENLIGKEGVDLLSKSEITVFGLGGVGSYALEILTRTGVGKINIIDNDIVDETNINRQIYALHSTIGKKKIDIAYERCIDINPSIEIKKYDIFIEKEEDIRRIIKDSDYILDCIDTISSKIKIVKIAKELNIPVISSMGAGNKLDPLKLKVRDIFNTQNCPVSKRMRKELRNINIKDLKVVCSDEGDKRIDENIKEISSISFVPSIAGILMASECIKDILDKNNKKLLN